MDIYSRTGISLKHENHATPPGQVDALARIEIPGSAEDALAWTTGTGTSPLSYLVILRNGSVSLLYYLGAADPRGIEVLDWNGDGHQDLYLRCTYDNDQPLMLNRAQVPGDVSFDTTAAGTRIIELPVGSGVIPEGLLCAAAGDLDGDGDDDLFAVDTTGSACALFRSPHVDHASEAPFLEITEWDTLATPATMTAYFTPSNQETSMLKQQEYTHLELVIYHQPAFGQDLEPQAVVCDEIPIGYSFARIPYAFNLNVIDQGLNDVFYFLVRKVVKDSQTGNYTQVSPMGLTWFTPREQSMIDYEALYPGILDVNDLDPVDVITVGDPGGDGSSQQKPGSVGPATLPPSSGSTSS